MSEKNTKNSENKDLKYVDGAIEAVKKFSAEVLQDLNNQETKLEETKPDVKKRRDLDLENGGLEVSRKKTKEVDDAWDKRSGEVQEMIEENAEKFINAATSTLRKSFIGSEKRKAKEEKNEAREEAAEAGFVAMIKAKRDKEIENNGRGG